MRAAMRLRVSVMVMVCCGILAACTAGMSAQEKAVEQMGVKDADSWVGLVDSGQYAKSWEEAAPVFQAAVTADQWAATLKRVREPLGKVRTRIVQSATRTSKLPGVPDGDYVVILYETSFEHKETGQETVFLSRERDKEWRVAGYYIK